MEELEKIAVLYQNTKFSSEGVLLSAHRNFVTIKEIYERLESRDQQKCVDLLEAVFLSDSDDIVTSIFHLSCLLGITKREQYVHKLITLVLNSQLKLSEKNFIYWQLIRKVFLMPNVLSFDVNVELRKLYRHIFMGYKQCFWGDCRWIPLQERNSNRIIIMTNQLLGKSHAPSKIIVEQAFLLQNVFHKEICIINTDELPHDLFVIPFFDPFMAERIDDYDKVTSITFGHQSSIPFYQCQKSIDSKNEMTKIIQFVESFKPGLILNIGGTSITADVCSSIVPVASMPMNDEIPITEGTFYILLRNLCQEDNELLDECHISRKRIIESRCPYQIEQQSEYYTRQELGIPEDRFVMAVVGNRLAYDITPEYVQQLNKFLEKNSKIFIAFIGEFDKYSDLAARYKTFERQTIHLGYKSDLQAVYDCCDAYLNPPRLGGGISAVLALFKGLPVFTLDYGDVGYIVGKKYHVTSWRDVEEFFIQWDQNAGFRATKKKAAKERAHQLTNIEDVMRKLLSDIRHSDFLK